VDEWREVYADVARWQVVRVQHLVGILVMLAAC
jgi:hypothetical protein